MVQCLRSPGTVDARLGYHQHTGKFPYVFREPRLLQWLPGLLDAQSCGRAAAAALDPRRCAGRCRCKCRAVDGRRLSWRIVLPLPRWCLSFAGVPSGRQVVVHLVFGEGPWHSHRHHVWGFLLGVCLPPIAPRCGREALLAAGRHLHVGCLGNQRHNGLYVCGDWPIPLPFWQLLQRSQVRGSHPQPPSGPRNPCLLRPHVGTVLRLGLGRQLCGDQLAHVTSNRTPRGLRSHLHGRARQLDRRHAGGSVRPSEDSGCLTGNERPLHRYFRLAGT
mmetsp:Transcript_143203/g.399183  ORF Transcript_143203/g.399183 Transcript_143203/m.399183 type:complete len:275 (+) Transcript_143203:225-1049(+)